MPLNLNNVSLRISAGLPKQFPTDVMVQVTFSGRSNVGKSSLINSLLGRKSLARVSASPGKTITINFTTSIKSCFWLTYPATALQSAIPQTKKNGRLLPTVILQTIPISIC